MFGFLALIYNAVCGGAAASDSLVKYQQGQRNMQEAIDKGEKVYYDGKGVMRTVGGNCLVYRGTDKNTGHDCLINHENGAVLRDFTEEKRQDDQKMVDQWNEERRNEALKKGKPYWPYTILNEGKNFDLELYHRVKKEGYIERNGASWYRSELYAECETRRLYQTEIIKEEIQVYDEKDEYGHLFKRYNTLVFFYKQYYQDERCIVPLKRTALTMEEYKYWGGYCSATGKWGWDFDKNNYYPYNSRGNLIDIESEYRRMNEELAIRNERICIDG